MFGFVLWKIRCVATAAAVDVQRVLDGGKKLDDSSLSGLGDKVDDIGGGAYGLMYKGGIFLIVLVAMGAAIGLVFANGTNRNESKSKLVNVVLGTILFFSVVGLVTMLANIGGSLFTSAPAPAPGP